MTNPRWRIHGTRWVLPLRDAAHKTTDQRVSRSTEQQTMQERLAAINKRNAEFYADLESKRSRQ
jgi:hypothetical protein